MMSTATVNNLTNETEAAPSKEGVLVHLVVQRYRSCSILLEETEWVQVGNAPPKVVNKDDETTTADKHAHCGLLVYVSFAVGTTQASVESAAECIANLPLLTTGLWGDGTSQQASLLEFMQSKQPTSVVLCPQANLIAKVKGAGRSLQYRGQIDKETGQQLFLHLARCLAGLLLEQQYQTRGNDDPNAIVSLPPLYLKWKKQREQQRQKESYEQQQQQRQSSQADPSVAPSDLFRTQAYSAWDDEGMPTKDAQGDALTKSALKKLKKIRDAHTKRHEKWLKQQEEQETKKPEDVAQQGGSSKPSSSLAKADETVVDDSWMKELDPNVCQLVVGSFGMRQGLNVSSDMGPFCHVMQI